MTYNLSSVRTRLQQKLDDASFDAATSNQFINDGQRYIFNSRRSIIMEAEADVTTSNGLDTLVGVPTTMQTPLSLRIHTPIGYATLLPYMEYEDLDQSMPNTALVNSNIPFSWYIFNRTPYIYPAAGPTVYNIKLRYIKTPTELVSDSQVPEVPEEFSEALVIAAYIRALEFNDENDKAQLQQLHLDELLSTMDERLKRQSGTPHIMRLLNRSRRVRGF